MLRWLIFWNFFLVYVRASLRQERTLETRLGEGRIRASEEWGKGGKGTPATTLLFTPNRPLFPWPGCIAGVFLFCFVFLLWLVSRRYSRAKAGMRSNQKTVGEGSREEVSLLLAPSSFSHYTSRGRVNTNQKCKSHQKIRQLRQLPSHPSAVAEFSLPFPLLTPSTQAK